MNIDKISELSLNLFHQLFPSNIWCKEYFISLANNLTAETIVTCVLVCILIYKATNASSIKENKMDIFRVYVAAVLAGAIGKVSKLLRATLFQDSYTQTEFLANTNFDYIFNPLSMLFISVIVMEYYKDKKSKAAFFLMAAIIISVIESTGREEIFIALWIILIVFSIVSSMLINIKYIYLYYFIINIFQIISKLVLEYIYNYRFNTEILHNKVFWSSEVPNMLMAYKNEYYIIIFFIIIWFFYEKFVVKEYYKKAI